MLLFGLFVRPIRLGSVAPRRILHTPNRSTTASAKSTLDCNQKKEESHFARFFANYPTFGYEPKSSFFGEWERMRKQFGWDKYRAADKKRREGGRADPQDGQLLEDPDERAYRRAVKRFRTSLVRQFNSTYGVDSERLPSWQALCQTVGTPVPKNLRGCKETIRNSHMNLVDLVEMAAEDGTEGTIQRFKTEKELSAYTMSTERFFPRDHAEEGGLLEKLLRHILNPRDSRPGMKASRKHAKGRRK